MAVIYKSNGRAMSLPGGVMLGAGVSVLWSVVTAAVAAKLIEKEVFSEDAIGYGCMIILLTASLLGSVTACKRVKRQRAVVCLCTGGAYFLTLLGITAMFFGGQYEAVGVTACMILAGCASVILMGLRQPGRRKYP